MAAMELHISRPSGQVEYPSVNSCNACRERRVIAWCDTCLKKLCLSCKTAHLKSSRSHSITLYDFEKEEYDNQFTNEAHKNRRDERVGLLKEKTFNNSDTRNTTATSILIDELNQEIKRNKDYLNCQCEETIRRINRCFDNYSEVLQRRKQTLCEQVNKTRLMIHSDIKDEYESVKKQLESNGKQCVSSALKPRDAKLQARLRNNSLIHITTNYKINWNSNHFDDICSKVDEIGSVEFCSIVPSFTKLKNGVGIVGKVCRVQLNTFDRDESPCTFGGMEFIAEVCTFKSSCRKCDVIDNHDGTYDIRFLPQQIGTHIITVKIPANLTDPVQGTVDCYDIVLSPSQAYIGKESRVEFKVVGTELINLGKIGIRVQSDDETVIGSTCIIDKKVGRVVFTPCSMGPYTLFILDQEGGTLKTFNIPMNECFLPSAFAYVENIVKIGKTSGVNTSIRVTSPDGENVSIQVMSEEESALTAKFFPKSNGIFQIFIAQGNLPEFCLKCPVGNLMVDVKGALVDGPCGVMLYACDCCGFLQKQLDYIPTISADIKSPGGLTKTCDVKFLGNSWTISFIPTTTGIHNLNIKVNRAMFKYSPISIDVSNHLEFAGGPSSEYFGNASDISTSVDGHIFVADTAQNNRIVILDPDGRFHSSIPVQTKDVSLLTNSDSKVYVLFVVKKILEVYDIKTHKLLLSFSVTCITSPSALCLNKITNALLISDTERKCVIVVDPDTGDERKSISPTGKTLLWPSDICLSSTGSLYVCDADAKVVIRMDTGGNCLDEKPFGNFDTNQHPIAISVDGDNQILILLREQKVYVYHSEQTLIEIIQVDGEISRRNKLQVSPDGCFIKTNEMENCLRKYRYTSVKKQVSSQRHVQKRTHKLQRRNANVFSKTHKFMSSNTDDIPDNYHNTIWYETMNW